jgi:hypothetical protein
MDNLINYVDGKFGNGYVKSNPQLLGQLIQAATALWSSSWDDEHQEMLAKWDQGSKHDIAEALKQIASAISYLPNERLEAAE